ncbi:Uncharacterised protein [Mycobacteroides abscessus subsp. abscessus]|nr:Uncharacterised protein [Mycobacteroides abscessus subsp. abscessus]
MPQSISSTDASKLGDATCSTRTSDAVAEVPEISASASTRLAMPRSATPTALGRPVDPEV